MFSFLPEANREKWIAFIHCCAWFIYGAYIYFVALLTDSKVTPLNVLVYLLPFIATFYITLYCLNLYKSKGIIWSVASFFIVFIVMAGIGYSYIFQVLPKMGIVLYKKKGINHYVQNAVQGYIEHFGYALLYFYSTRAITRRRKIEQMEIDKARMEKETIEQKLEALSYEHAFLRAQINPHFLHNTLNMLYSRALPYSDELAEDIANLSTIMRYSVESLEYKSDKVLVKKELDNLQILLTINAGRFRNAIIYSVEGEVTDQMLPPLSFITVVENAFKYGELSDPDNPLEIKIKLHPSLIYFFCRNKKRGSKSHVSYSSNNIGITNLSKRLDHAFKDRYEMKANDHDGIYTFELTIKT